MATMIRPYTAEILQQLDLIKLIPGVGVVSTHEDAREHVITVTISVHGQRWEQHLDIFSPDAPATLAASVMDLLRVQRDMELMLAPVHNAIAEGDTAKAITALAQVVTQEATSRVMAMRTGCEHGYVAPSGE